MTSGLGINTSSALADIPGQQQHHIRLKAAQLVVLVSVVVEPKPAGPELKTVVRAACQELAWLWPSTEREREYSSVLARLPSTPYTAEDSHLSHTLHIN